MEFDLVEDSVIVAEVQEAIQETEEYEEFISEFDNCAEPGESHTRLSLTNFSVALNSIEDHDEETFLFGRVNQILKRRGQHFADVKLELIRFQENEMYTDKYGNREGGFNAYLLLSDMKKSDPKEETVNILERLEHAFGENEVHFDIELSLAYLLTKDAHVSLDKVFTLKATNLKYCSLPHRIGGLVGPFPSIMDDMWWDDKTGFVSAKLSVKVKVDEDAANYFLKFGNCTTPKSLADMNRKLDDDGVCPDVEICCKSGAKVNCHSEFLLPPAANDWQKKLVKDLKESKTRPLAVQMDISEEGVKAFLEWISCKNLTKALVSSEVALELLKAGKKYEVQELETEMEKLLMSKATGDLKYFSVETALNLYLYVKDDWDLKYLRDKAVRVLKSYTKVAGRKLNESVEYQNFFKNNLQQAMELSHLYGRLS